MYELFVQADELPSIILNSELIMNAGKGIVFQT
jgi:hypothetical protein